MTACSRKGCGLPVDEGGVCFAHKAAAIADALAEVAVRRKALVVTAGGVTVQLHPEAWEAVVTHEPEVAPAMEPEDPPKSLRELAGDGDEINGLPLDESVYDASEGAVPTEDPA